LLQGLMDRFDACGEIDVVHRGEKSILFDIRYQDKD
jgi:hypothetical protein